MDLDLDKLQVQDLKRELELRGEDTRGTKQVLKERLAEILKEEARVSRLEPPADEDETKKSASSIRSQARKSGSACSGKSSVASSRIKEAAKQAGLKARAEALKKRYEIEMEELKLKMKKEQVEIEAEIAESKAKEEVLASQEVKEEQEPKQEQAPNHDKEPKQEQAPYHDKEPKQEQAPYHDKEPKHENETKQEQEHRCEHEHHQEHDKRWGQNRTDEHDSRPEQQSKKKPAPAMNEAANAVKRVHLPLLELKTFGGEVESFRPFIRTFEANIASRLDCEEEKLLYLMKFTSGKANDIVSTCMHLPPGQGYNEAIKLLHKRYDNQVQTVAGLMDKMTRQPPIRTDDVDALDTFGIFLRGCLNAFKSMPHGVEAVDARTIRQLVEKLPHHMVEKWRRLADATEQEQKRLPSLVDFVEFVEKEARIASNPSYGKHMVTPQGKRREVVAGRTEEKSRKNHTTSKTWATKTLKPSNDHRQHACTFCKKMHAVDECQALEQSKEEDKTSFVMSNGLCFGCLERGHRSRECKKRLTCSKCGMPHPSVLHRNQPVQQHPQTHTQHHTQPNNQPHLTVTTGHTTSRTTNAGKLHVVKVLLQYRGKTVTTGAFLDPGSTHSFISRNLADDLGVPTGETTKWTVSTINGERKMEGSMVSGITMKDICQNHHTQLPPLYTLDAIPVSSDDAPSQPDVDGWPYLKEKGVLLDALSPGEQVGLLIGSNAAQIMEPLEVVASQDGGPYAVRTRYGWILGGAMRVTSSAIKVNRIKLELPDQLHDEFENLADTRKGLSVEDVKWCLKVESSCHKKENGGYEIDLPFRDIEPALEENYIVAKRRLDMLKNKLDKNPEFASLYKGEVAKLVEKGHAEKAPENSEGRWFLPHHGVLHAQKAGKLRVVFDCASEYNGESLNSTLLQGPDLTNPLIHVLIRFRQEPVAFKADIEGMFLQVSVPQHHRDYLRFLWWPGGNTDKAPEEYRMTKHLFGATSSPSCANYALHRTAEEFGSLYNEEVPKTIRRNFYVDDVCKSVPTEEACIRLAADLKKLCAHGGFNLTKFSSNSLNMLQSLKDQDRADNVKVVNPSDDSPSSDQVLGVPWDLMSDSMGFRLNVKELKLKPPTRRGMLSATAGCFDPLGIVSPCVVQARMILQDLTRLRLGWDDQAPPDIRRRWRKWLDGLVSLERLWIARCLGPFGLSAAEETELHIFADASANGYGIVSYIRTIHGNEPTCAFLFSRAYVAPVKAVSIPRLELNAAKIAVQVGAELTRALDEKPARTLYWTDSTTVLKYIKNEQTRFHVFVANRLAVIHDGSNPDQWNHVPSHMNPADLVSRGTDGERLLRSEIWKEGPHFLWQSAENWPTAPEKMEILEGDPEVKTTLATHSVKVSECENAMEKLISHFSTWRRLTRAVAWIRLVFKNLLCRSRGITLRPAQLTLEDMEEAEISIVKHVQNSSFDEELKDLHKGNVKTSSSIVCLDPVLDQKGLLRVGGRLKNSCLSEEAKFPLILPNKGAVTDLIIDHVHQKSGHEGRQHTLTKLRSKYWILKSNSAVRRCLSRCYSCRRRRHPPEATKMADLPPDRVVETEKAFWNTGTDLFGPFYVKKGRGQVKKYGVIFTCLATRAVHIEVAESQSADSFICALKRFIARRGDVRLLRSDCGSNFVAADKELRAELNVLRANEKQIASETLKKGIEWKFNPPCASSFGGVWERLIRSIRKILNALMQEQSLTEETLQTLLCEVECILNNRPLTPVSSDFRDEDPITPNHLLNLRCICVPASFPDEDDKKSRKNWRQATYLAEKFWSRWRAEYLPLLQKRPGPTTRSGGRNLQVGDIVLVVDKSVPRGVWQLGRVVETKKSQDASVRSVKVRTQGGILQRPSTKLVRLV